MASTRRAQQTAATRDDIVVASLRLFARRGFHHTSIADIASAAGITKGAIYWHFTSKEALFNAILDRIKSDWRQTVMIGVEDETDPRNRLSKLFDNYLVLFTQESEICVFLQRVLLELDDPNSAIVAKVFESTARFIGRIVEAGQRDGVFRADADPTLVATAIIGALAGATGQCAANSRVHLGALVGEIKAQVLARLTA